jgi:hypothetical protein
MNQIKLDPADARIVSDAVRRRMRTIALDAYRSFATSREADFVAPPASAEDDAGMLGEAYWGTDATHGNGEYGAMYLQDVLDWAAGAQRG